MTFNELYQLAKTQFKDAGIETAALDARVLICHHAGMDQAEFMVSQDKSVGQSVEKEIQQALLRRIDGEPISKILGQKEFWGLDFKVTKNTLSPRPETEILIEQVLRWIREQEKHEETLSILDLGTGTGCIPIALLSELPHAKAILVDKSPSALKIAQENAEKYKMTSRVEFIESDWFTNLGDQTFDIITSNPPYISESEMESLPKEVKNHDPILSLCGGVHGLDPYEIIFSNLNSHLKEGGCAFFEIGQNQLSDIMRLVDDSNLQLCESTKDLAGIERVVQISCGDK
ncbi:MAG: peptide chain release factor N(5)-glutamine methyltransferase [Pseudomonadota bacterium]